MKKTLVIFFLVLTTLANAQFALKTPYQVMEDSIALSHYNITLMRLKLTPVGLVVFRPEKWVKITIKPMINSIAHMGAEEGGDYFNVSKYDIRVKIYFSRRIAWVNRWLLNGASDKKYIYQTGISLKF